MERRTALKLFGAASIASASASSLAGDPTGRDEVQYVGDVERVQFKPGDVIIVRCPDHLPVSVMEQMREHVSALFGGAKVVVLTGGTTLGVIGT
jgi:hypothetical protein